MFSLSSGLESKNFHWRFTHSSAENPPIYAKRRRRISPLVSNTSGMVPNEFQAFYPVVRIRIESPPPSHPQESFAPLPLGPRGETRLRGRGWGDSNPTMRQTLCYSGYTMIPLRYLPSLLFVFRLSLWQVTYCLCEMPVKQLDRRLCQSVGFKFFIQPSAARCCLK